MSLSKKIKIFSKSLGFPDDVANSRWIAANLPEEIKEFIKDDYMRKKNLNYKLFYDFILKIRNQTNSQDNLDKLLMEYQNYYLIDCINKHTNKANMINSVEARSPLLSHHLFAKVNSLKIYHKKNKKIIKNFLSINKYKFMKRKKGFTVPIGEWINSIFKDEIIEAFSKKNLSRYGIFNHKYLNEKILEPHLLKKINNDKKIWNIFILIKWMENNIKNVHFS